MGNMPENKIKSLEKAKQKLEEKMSKDRSNGTLINDISRMDEYPGEKVVSEDKKAVGYSGDYFGAFSLERFASASSLRYTHEDAKGWLDYLDKFNDRNFWYKDANVKIWAYYEQYDNWQDTYGMDAVKAVYHSGHGGMTSSGKFYVPLGGDWGGLGTTAWSDKMRLGNEQVRYIWWSTCLSLRVTGGHSPIRTWNIANLGFRMLFGYDTTSIDSKRYGEYFWKEWNKGKSFSTAFMDASWKISTNQRPSVTACGKTRDEAKNRVYNERLLYWGSVSRDWWWWRWYYKTSSMAPTRAIMQNLPTDILIPYIKIPVVNTPYVNSILARHNVSPGGLLTANSLGTLRLGDDITWIAVDPKGSYEIQLARPNIENTTQINVGRAVDIAEAYIRQYGLGDNDLVLDSIGHAMHAGGTITGSGELVEPVATETILRFVQVINGVPVISSETGGDLIIRVDNDGIVTGIANSKIIVDDLRKRSALIPSSPGEEDKISEVDPKTALNNALQEMMREWIVKGTMPHNYSAIPGTFEVGYAVIGSEVIPVARQEIEVDCGQGFMKRYLLEVPIYT